MSLGPKKTILVTSVGRFAPAGKFAGGHAQSDGLLQADLKKANEAGFETEYLEVNPQDPSMLDMVKEKLKSKHWDGFSVGYGVRGLKENTALFEDIMNASREASPHTKYLFSVGPDSVFEAIQRAFPEK